MKRPFLLAPMTLGAVLAVHPAMIRAGRNVWTSIGPEGGQVQALAVDPQNPGTVYAIGGGGIFKTTDGAANWKRVYPAVTNDGGANYPATAVALNPKDSSTLYAGTANAGIFKSTDGGASWNFSRVVSARPVLLKKLARHARLTFLTTALG
jgi:photosystem II stability/assembly factor-like uncharacterized protein